MTEPLIVIGGTIVWTAWWTLVWWAVARQYRHNRDRGPVD